MNPLRHAHRLARFMLAWFALSLAVAVASPLVHPQQVELLCSAGGQVKAVVHTASGDTLELGAGHLDCPLCIPAGAPGPLPLLALAEPAPSFVLDLTVAAAPAAATTLPWQARAPPSLRS
ncbi:MAG TPA: hypothetical protein PKE22_07065 [Ottowia sp.]|jgi:hypothetical protein|nr:hypothetical protein [Ottowia sp.]OJV52638.1 MAG: hypothetical protein BGO36_15455 [Burkholderiales bacterium 68-10]HMT18207.1 hypothetical protein [Ottowia sp.]HMT64590.1 hypothetical protein [Ottowia sp.]HMT82691.1 hypothetical protein [Ottowia sp.]